MAQCDKCGKEISRYKTNNGHMDGCPTLQENQPSKGKGRSPKYHTSDWQKSGKLGNSTVWRCKTCGTQTQTDGAKPGPAQHRGKPRD